MPKRTMPLTAHAKPPAGEAAKRKVGRKSAAANRSANAEQHAPNGATPSVRELRSQARRESILSAALEEFSAAGYAATRLDDVARRAGIAKGTIYLYFADKETLFQELARSMLSPVIGHIEKLASADIPFQVLTEGLVDMFTREVIASRRKDIIRLIIAEGPRFPALAEFYYREVLSRVIAALRVVLQRAYDRGEMRHKALIEFPQLLAAPAMIAVIWSSLFERMAPLDARAMLKAHLDILLDRGRTA
jgi:AcrR family transcriptional regulator